jgi:hypothetical protein
VKAVCYLGLRGIMAVTGAPHPKGAPSRFTALVKMGGALDLVQSVRCAKEVSCAPETHEQDAQ